MGNTRGEVAERPAFLLLLVLGFLVVLGLGIWQIAAGSRLIGVGMVAMALVDARVAVVYLRDQARREIR